MLSEQAIEYAKKTIRNTTEEVNRIVGSGNNPPLEDYHLAGFIITMAHEIAYTIPKAWNDWLEQQTP